MDIKGLVGIINEFMWGQFLIYALLGTGIYYTIRLGFPQLSMLGHGFKYTFGAGTKKESKDKKEGMSSFQALATSIAAQVGTGNLAGVAAAIASGGPGAIFWMWVSAIFGMGTIFGEAILAQKYKEVRGGEFTGGPAYYLSKGAKSKILAIFLQLL